MEKVSRIVNEATRLHGAVTANDVTIKKKKKKSSVVGLNWAGQLYLLVEASNGLLSLYKGILNISEWQGLE